MDVFINERAVGAVEAVGATVGEMIEALGVHVDPDEIVTTVEIDGVTFSAGDEERYVRRAAANVRRLVLGTSTPDVPTGESITTDQSLMPMASTAIGLPGPLRSASVACFLTRRLSDQVSPSRRR